jgi:hypothetical protein
MTDRRHTHRATCQVCGRVQALRDGSTIAKHGYTVDWGWFNGTCEGSDNAPVEHDLALLNITANSLMARAENFESITIDKITDVTVTTRTQSGEKIETICTDQAEVELTGSRDTFARLAEVKLFSLKQHAKHLRSHVAMLYGIAKERHGAEPYEVKQLEAAAAKASAEKAARPTKASVKRFVEGLNREFSKLWNDHRAATYAADVPYYLHQYRAEKHAHAFGDDAAKVDELVEQMKNEKAKLNRA